MMKGYGKIRSRPVVWLLKFPPVALFSHWTFQSLFYMDHTERWFKIALDVALTALVSVFLRLWFPMSIALVLAFILAHTMNFLFNGQYWGVLKHYGLVRLTRSQFNSYVLSFKTRTQGENSIHRALIYGSLVRDEWSPGSDLDVRIIRRPGLINGIQACRFALVERSRALLARFPLDLYIFDSPKKLRTMNDNETALDIFIMN